MISILLAVYNGEKYIKKSIDSIINQSFKEWELLIGFNGTTDSSKEIVNSYEDNRIKIFDYKEKGKGKTLNKLIEKVSHNLIALQDDDDIWEVNKLEYQFRLLEKYDVVGSYIEYIDENDNVTGYPDLYSDHGTIKRFTMWGDNQIANSSTIFKLRDVLEVNGWDEEIDGIEDYDFWLKLLKSNKKFFNVPLKLVKHRLHKDSNFNTKNFNIQSILDRYI